MLIDETNAENQPVLSWLEEVRRSYRPLTPPAEANDPYYEAGSHPDVVAWMWEKLSKKFSDDSRCLVYGVPCVIQPVSGVILAVAMGTAYCLRILPESASEAAKNTNLPTNTWGGGDTTDLREIFGSNWVFGSFDDACITWCRAAYHHFSTPPAPGARILTPATEQPVENTDAQLTLLVGQEPNFTMQMKAADPSAEQVESVVRSVDWSRFATVLLRNDEQRYLVVSGSLRAEDGLSASYMDGDDEHVTSTAPSLDEAITMLQSYAAGDSLYKTLVKWD